MSHLSINRYMQICNKLGLSSTNIEEGRMEDSPARVALWMLALREKKKYGADYKKLLREIGIPSRRWSGYSEKEILLGCRIYNEPFFTHQEPAGDDPLLSSFVSNNEIYLLNGSGNFLTDIKIRKEKIIDSNHYKRIETLSLNKVEHVQFQAIEVDDSPLVHINRIFDEMRSDGVVVEDTRTHENIRPFTEADVNILSEALDIQEVFLKNYKNDIFGKPLTVETPMPKRTEVVSKFTIGNHTFYRKSEWLEALLIDSAYLEALLAISSENTYPKRVLKIIDIINFKKENDALHKLHPVAAFIARTIDNDISHQVGRIRDSFMDANIQAKIRLYEKTPAVDEWNGNIVFESQASDTRESVLENKTIEPKIELSQDILDAISEINFDFGEEI